MRYFTVATILASLTTLALGYSTDPAANKTMSWTGPSKGVNVTLYGRADEIMSQLKALDPDWIPMSKRPGFVPRSYNSNQERAEGNYICCPVPGQPWTPVSGYGLLDSAQMLIDIGGACLIIPDECQVAQQDTSGSMAACSQGAGIWLCDSTPDTFIGTNCADLGHYTNDLVYDCLDVGDSIDNNVCGQMFDTSGQWNIVLANCPGTL